MSTSEHATAGPAAPVNADPVELAKFSELAHRWWDLEGEFKPLHLINPVRLAWIESHQVLKGLKVLDVGCGGGILSDAMARQGAQVTGIDLSEKALKVAQMHALETGTPNVSFRVTAVEDLAREQPAGFEVVTCMEMLEHVPDPASVVRACADLVKPGGWVFFSTINRNARAFLQAIVAAEYVLNLLPRGTHEYAKLIQPAEMARSCRAAGLAWRQVRGMSYNPLTHRVALNDDPRVNYLVATQKEVS